MAKHTAEKSKSLSKQDKTRQRHMEQWELLAPRARKVVEEALEAVKPCSYCSLRPDQKTGEMVLYAAKKDEQDKCIECHGTNVVQDKDSRKWAAEEVNARVVPKPKAVELEVDDKREVEEWMSNAEELSDDAVTELAKQMNFVFKSESNGATGA